MAPLPHNHTTPTTVHSTPARVPQLICPTTDTTSSAAPITNQSTIPSDVQLPNSILTFVPLASKGKAIMVDQDDEFPIYIIHLGTTSGQTILMRS